MRRTVGWLSFVVALFLPLTFGPASADTRPGPEDRGASGLALVLRRLQTIGSVLHTGAHPDDESSELLAYLSRGQSARTAYLSLNRGEGGQNGIGPELWDSLGVIRTEELLAARKLDGAEQYFTRAFDFGFTSSAEETLRKWNHDEVLADIVRVIRTMRPLVVVNGFSGTPQDGHGHHQVAATLTREAIQCAADANLFPEQIASGGLEPWQVLKVYERRFKITGPRLDVDTGAYDPVLGRSYAELAADARSRYRTQDFGMLQARGTQVRALARAQSAVSVRDAENSLFGGIDVSIAGIAKFAGDDDERILPRLAAIQQYATRAFDEFRVEYPDAIAPELAAGLREVRSLRGTLPVLDPVRRATVDGMLARKEQEFTDALLRSHGVIVDALADTEIVAPGESVDVTANVFFTNRSVGNADAKTAAPQIHLRAPAGWSVKPRPNDAEPRSGVQPAVWMPRERPDSVSRFRVTVRDDEPPTQPYWLAEPRTHDQFEWDASMPQGLPFAPPLASAMVELTLSGERVTVTQPVEYRFVDRTLGEIRRELKVAPALTLTVRPSLLVIPVGATNRTREVSVEVINNARQPTAGSLNVLVPPNWKVDCDSRELSFTGQHDKIVRTVRVTPPVGIAGDFSLNVVAEANHRQYDSGYSVIAYPHIESHLIYRRATAKVELFDVKVARNLRVGYVVGSGDEEPDALRQLGLSVTILNAADLASGDLSVYDSIVLGIRVYEFNKGVIASNKRLLEYVHNGGTLIVQYNKNDYMNGSLAPFPLQMARVERVTDENAPVTVLVPEHPLFNFPNRITADDWTGWTQERGLYFVTDWDDRYTPLLASADEGDAPLRGGQLIAPYGNGLYVYTAYSWFRQLPAGVPGAYRLFANLVSYPKHPGRR